MVRSLIRNGLRGSSLDLERHSVGVEKARGDGREGAGQVVGARRVVRIRRVGNQRRPCRIGLRLRVSVVVRREKLLNRRDRSPEVVVLLTVPGSDASIGAGQVGQGEQPGTVTETV